MSDKPHARHRVCPCGEECRAIILAQETTIEGLRAVIKEWKAKYHRDRAAAITPDWLIQPDLEGTE